MRRHDPGVDSTAGTSARADAPVKQNDHAMDDIRYFAATLLARGSRAYAAAVARG
ncbi:MAG: hypothetical protein ACLVL7_13045 [Anaerotruncus massiliensis (ex Togo et al. 2019)]